MSTSEPTFLFRWTASGQLEINTPQAASKGEPYFTPTADKHTLGALETFMEGACRQSEPDLHRILDYLRLVIDKRREA